jgi:hypothetical protein
MTDDADEVIKISEIGHASLVNDTQMSDDNRLAMEIIARLKDTTWRELETTVDELTAVFGSAGAAVEAIKNGYVKIGRPDE